jgi:signal transduction histidine kinase
MQRRDVHASRWDEQDELQRAARLTALGEFAASVAHEVRQPLTAIVMNARSGLRSLGGNGPLALDEARACLLDVLEAGERAEEVIRRNRDLFRHHRVRTIPLDVNVVVREALAMAAPRLAESRVQVETSLAADVPLVSGDRIELQQVLLNLVANAVDAMEGRPARRLRIASSCERGDVRVAVSDTGVGLEHVDLQQLFKLSYTTKPSGTGVGLSVSRAIVDAHGGRLWAEPNPAGGATFVFMIPARNEAVQHGTLSPEPGTRNQAGRERLTMRPGFVAGV